MTLAYNEKFLTAFLTKSSHGHHSQVILILNKFFLKYEIWYPQKKLPS